ncbi:hypothetical protein [Staphylococcus coagulans]|uniref:hypothetical protein n=1 Tax=Staphylococcus coagulans TaxID=74706 RepID=UPI002871136E|nr:hypothetical protein [Staphylococcus coagulans]MDR9833584.1 hypothetical protein [Staphylococcus coagulans]
MLSKNWLEIKRCVETHNHEEVVKGIIAHLYEIDDINKLDTIYLTYMDDDSIMSIINEEYH